MTWDAMKVATLVVFGNAIAALWDLRAELLASLALLAGWLLITHSLTLMAPAWFDQIWALSIGVLLVSLAGWRLLWAIATTGLYALTREKGERAGRNA